MRRRPEFDTVARSGLFKKAHLEQRADWGGDSSEKLGRAVSRQKGQQVQRPQESSRKRKEAGGPGQECGEQNADRGEGGQGQCGDGGAS